MRAPTLHSLILKSDPTKDAAEPALQGHTVPRVMAKGDSQHRNAEPLLGFAPGMCSPRFCAPVSPGANVQGSTQQAASTPLRQLHAALTEEPSQGGDPK